MSDGTQKLIDHRSAFGTTIVQQGHLYPGESTGSLLGDSRSWISWKATFWKDKHQLPLGTPRRRPFTLCLIAFFCPVMFLFPCQRTLS